MIFLYKKNSQPISRVLCFRKLKCLSFIYDGCHQPSLAIYPPTRADHPQTSVYLILQPIRRTACLVTKTAVGSYPTFSPLLSRSGYFLLHYSTLANGFPLGSMVSYVARTFLFDKRSDRPADCFIVYCFKGTSINYFIEILRFMHSRFLYGQRKHSGLCDQLAIKNIQAENQNVIKVLIGLLYIV